MWDDYDGRWDMHDGSAAMWVFMALFFVALVALAVVVIFALLRGTRTSDSAPPQQPPGAEAERILRRRFAAGEIDEDEFRKRMSALADHVT